MLSSSVPHLKGLKRKAKLWNGFIWESQDWDLFQNKTRRALLHEQIWREPSSSTFRINISYYQQWLTADKGTHGTLLLVTVLGCDSLLATRPVAVLVVAGSHASAVPFLTNWTQFRWIFFQKQAFLYFNANQCFASLQILNLLWVFCWFNKSKKVI